MSTDAEDAAVLSRDRIRGMSVAEFDQREAEIMRWLRAGATDGEAAPPTERPEGHTFTRAEIGGMDLADFERHEARIFDQLRTSGIN